MAQAEKYSWASLITTGLLLWFFFGAMTENWRVVDYGAQQLFGVFIKLVIAAIILESVVAGAMAFTHKNQEIEKDERDLAIENRAMRNGYYLLFGLVVTLIITSLATGLGYEQSVPLLKISTLAQWFFALFCVLFIATLAERISTLIYYRRG